MTEHTTHQQSMDEIVFGGTREIDYLLKKAVAGIDEQFGEGFAKANPSLVAAYMQAGATLSASIGAGIVEDAATKIADAIGRLADVVDGAFGPDEG